MAAAAPSHRIPSIHGAFGGHGRCGPSSMTPAQASWNRIPNVCAPRRAPSSYEVAPGPRTTLASLSCSSSGAGAGTGRPSAIGVRASVGPSASGSRPRRTTMSHGSYGPSSPLPTRRAPPPPPVPSERTVSSLSPPPVVSVSVSLPALAPAPIPALEDPFADAAEAEAEDLSPFPPVVSISARTRISTSLNMQSTQLSLVAPPGLQTVPNAKDIRARMVASTLLNRGSGRPLGVYLRRRLSGEGTAYVKSGLSQLVAAAA